MSDDETSPLKAFQTFYCAKCKRGCNPGEVAFLSCLLAHMANSLSKISAEKEVS